MNGRAWVFALPAVVLAGIACGKGTSSDDRVGGVRSGAEADFVGLCSYEPWNGGPATTECGDASTVHHRVTCDELGSSPGVPLVLSAPDALDFREASHQDPSGIESRVTVHDDTGATVVNSWSFSTTVKPDGSTMTFDALVFTSNTGEDSEVIRFSEPQFFVRNLTTTIGVVDQVELCGYRAFQSPSLPPPPPTPPDPTKDSYTLNCTGNGSATAPGPTVHTTADIHWTVSLDPASEASVDNTVFSFPEGNGSAFTGTGYPLFQGSYSGGYPDNIPPIEGSFKLRFTYYKASCELYWTIDGDASEPDAGTSSSSSSGGSQTW